MGIYYPASLNTISLCPKPMRRLDDAGLMVDALFCLSTYLEDGDGCGVVQCWRIDLA